MKSLTDINVNFRSQFSNRVGFQEALYFPCEDMKSFLYEVRCRTSLFPWASTVCLDHGCSTFFSFKVSKLIYGDQLWILEKYWIFLVFSFANSKSQFKWQNIKISACFFIFISMNVRLLFLFSSLLQNAK